jgi:glycerol-3-phosphate dehydrogenase
MNFDVAIVGGGITGMAVALDIARSGQRVALLEADRFGTATSANSHCVIHGGFRYLAHANLARVLQSQRDLSHILKNYSDATDLLECYMPLRGKGLKRPLPSWLGVQMYRALAGLQLLNLQAPKVLRALDDKNASSVLTQGKGYLRWYDGLLHDHVTLVELLLAKLRDQGVVLLDKFVVVEIAPDGGGHVVRSSDKFFRARAVVGCLGPWMVNGPLASAKEVTLARAFNVVVNRKFSRNVALAGQSPHGRLYFLVPRQDGVAIGTGYLEHVGNEISSDIEAQEVDDFLKESNAAFAWPPLAPEEVVRVESGVIPVASFAQGVPKFLNESIVQEVAPGYWSVLSVKYTGFPSTASRVSRLVGKYLAGQKS